MPRKTEKLTIRIDPVVKEALRQASDHDNRSIANLLEVLILEHCRKTKIDIPELKPNAEGKATRTRRVHG